jgi:MFS family permease
MSLIMNVDDRLEEKLLPKAWLFVFLLSIVGCLNYLDRIMITTMRSSIVEAIPMTDTQFGLLTSSFLWVYGLLSPVGGYLADRFRRSHVVICSLLLWSLVTWLTAHASTFEELLATRILMGISEACYMPAALALITDYHKGPTRSLAVGFHMVGVIAGQGLGFVGGWMAETNAWNYAFNFFGITGIIYALLLALVLKDAPGRSGQKLPDTTTHHKGETGVVPVSLANAFTSLFSKRSFLLALGFWGLLGIAGWMIVGWLPTYYKEQYNLSQTSAGLYATAYLYAASMVGVLFGGWIADRWSRTNPRARIYVPAIGLLIAAPGILFASTTSVLAVTVAGFMTYAFTKAFSDANMMPILCMVADKRYRATGYGVLNLFSCIIGGVGLYMGGVLRDANVNLSGMFIVAGVALFVCAVLLFAVKPVVEEG